MFIKGINYKTNMTTESCSQNQNCHRGTRRHPATSVGWSVGSFVNDDEVGSKGGVDTETARSRASTENMGVFWVKVRRRTFALSFRQTSFKKKSKSKRIRDAVD